MRKYKKIAQNLQEKINKNVGKNSKYQKKIKMLTFPEKNK